MGKKFVKLSVVNTSDVKAICMANGVADRQAIQKIHDDCDCDLRRVKRLIHAYKKDQNESNEQ
jgi:hypothetical protein